MIKMIDIVFNIALYSKVKDIVNIGLCNKQCYSLINIFGKLNISLNNYL